MDTPSVEAERLRRLRAQRQVELASRLPPEPSSAVSSAHRAPLIRVHDSVRAVLAQIDAAEAGMGRMLDAWEWDPVRGEAPWHISDAGTPKTADPLIGPKANPAGTTMPTVPLDEWAETQHLFPEPNTGTRPAPDTP